ncbi:hypothetical protein [Amycolatopsis sp. cmx-4-68]|uniref:hypothetical protein n=1 Tax=Amycolatopsis sp. cmx-4-68 TaxID=2790938 RepID=UPI00397CC85D
MRVDPRAQGRDGDAATTPFPRAEDPEQLPQRHRGGDVQRAVDRGARGADVRGPAQRDDVPGVQRHVQQREQPGPAGAVGAVAGVVVRRWRGNPPVHGVE